MYASNIAHAVCPPHPQHTATSHIANREELPIFAVSAAIVEIRIMRKLDFLSRREAKVRRVLSFALLMAVAIFLFTPTAYIGDSYLLGRFTTTHDIDVSKFYDGLPATRIVEPVPVLPRDMVASKLQDFPVVYLVTMSDPQRLHDTVENLALAQLRTIVFKGNN